MYIASSCNLIAGYLRKMSCIWRGSQTSPFYSQKRRRRWGRVRSVSFSGLLASRFVNMNASAHLYPIFGRVSRDSERYRIVIPSSHLNNTSREARAMRTMAIRNTFWQEKGGTAREDEIYQWLVSGGNGAREHIARSNNARDSGMLDLSWQHIAVTWQERQRGPTTAAACGPIYTFSPKT